MSPVQPHPRALSEGSLILVTGASGFIGSHIVNEALAAGYKVRGTARSQEKADKTKSVFNHNPNYSTTIVTDFVHEGGFDDAVKGVAAVIHVASDTTFSPDPNEVIPGVISGVKSILNSCIKEPSVKRFVLTSSSAAALLPKPGKKFTVTVGDWNEEAHDLAWAPPPYKPDRAYAVYASSKAEGEKAMWNFVKERNPHFVVNAVLPNFNMGKVLHAPGPTGVAVPQVLQGKPQGLPPQYMVDVIDDARIHVIAAALDSSLTNQRIFAFAHPFNWTLIANAVRKARPDATTVLTPPANEPEDLSQVPNELGAELLRKWYGQTEGWKSLQQSVEENLEGY